ncbi:SPOR domain-containing protein [Massilia eurypsychrophila]|uniref:SPOR domain-containing protein n=1 Tax=Massilia eurypsychrophila TaxID=1485217 RepID=A0A2G8TCB3_9BURK|nr:SPOR domain-containing protein [Massilia eurypsychrophila]PIL43691.1 SPOR domain-containing protein [Massilia eurypsychrophila]
MGLFSFLNKNKQDTTADDSGYYSRDEDSVASRARSKRASSAGEPAAPRRERKSRGDDPVLPEKKRARRRLVGAIALALAVAVGLPMVLDSEPKPLAGDIAFQIPSRDKAPPLPVPAVPGAVTAADSLDKREEFIDPPKPEPREIKTVAVAEPKVEPKPAPPKDAPKAEAKPEAKPEQKPEPKVAKAEPKAVEPKVAEPKPAKVAVKEDKPAAKPEDAARALNILEGKPPAVAADKFVVQVAALGTAEKVAELQGKLKDAGIRSFTHKVSTAGGERIQVQVGPFSREEADRMRARLDKVGMPGSIVKPDGK